MSSLLPSPETVKLSPSSTPLPLSARQALRTVALDYSNWLERHYPDLHEKVLTEIKDFVDSTADVLTTDEALAIALNSAQFYDRYLWYVAYSAECAVRQAEEAQALLAKAETYKRCGLPAAAVRANVRAVELMEAL